MYKSCTQFHVDIVGWEQLLGPQEHDFCNHADTARSTYVTSESFHKNPWVYNKSWINESFKNIMF